MLHDFSKTCYINLATKMRYHISDANRFLSVCVSGHVLLFQKQLFVFFIIMSSEQCMYPLICQMSFYNVVFMHC